LWSDQDASKIAINVNDGIVYLNEYKNTNSENKSDDEKIVSCVNIGFDFERDYYCCKQLYSLISNIIETRKFYFIKPKDKPLTLFTFKDVNINKIHTQSTGMRFEHTV